VVSCAHDHEADALVVMAEVQFSLRFPPAPQSRMSMLREQIDFHRADQFAWHRTTTPPDHTLDSE